MSSRITYANVMATVAVFLALGGGALATGTLIGSDGRIHGCVAKNGSLKVLKRGKHCGRHQTKITWSQTGPRGPQGVQGLQGLQGQKGDTGSVDTSNFFDKSQSDARYAGSQRTYIGTDFEPIDGRTETHFASNTGGGVWPGSMPLYFEARPELPAGALITQVTFFYRQCMASTTSAMHFYYGNYDPAAAGFTYGNTSGGEVAADYGSSCTATTSMQLAAAPNFRIDPAKRFVLGSRFSAFGGSTYDPGIPQLLVGARVDYSLP